MANWQVILLTISIVVPVLGGWLFWGWKYTQKKRASNVPQRVQSPQRASIQTASPIASQPSVQRPSAVCDIPYAGKEPMLKFELERIIKNSIHLFVFGDSGSGKSTFLSSMINYLVSLEPDTQVCVLSPHTKALHHNGQNYPIFAGLPVAKKHDEMVVMAQKIKAELDQRIALDDLGEDLELFPLLVVLDEYSAIVKNKQNPLVTEIVDTLAREGRKYNIKVIISNQSELVKALDMEGSSDTKANFKTIRLGENMVKTKEAKAMGRYAGEIVQNGVAATIKTAEWVQGSMMQLNASVNCWEYHTMLAMAAHRKQRALEVLNNRNVSSNNELRDMILSGIDTSDENTSSLVPSHDTSTILDTDTIMNTSDELQVIAKMIYSGSSGNDIIKALGGNRNKRIEQIKYAKQHIVPQYASQAA